MHYSEKLGSVRVELFKPSGKWKYTAAIDMGEFYNDMSGPQSALARALDNDSHWSSHWRQYTVVCFEPYHKYSYPVMIVSEENW